MGFPCCPFSLSYHNRLLFPRSCSQNALREKQTPNRHSLYVPKLSSHSKRALKLSLWATLVSVPNMPVIMVSQQILARVIMARLYLVQVPAVSPEGSLRAFSLCDLVTKRRRERLKNHSPKTSYINFSHFKEFLIFFSYSLEMGDRVIFRQSL